MPHYFKTTVASLSLCSALVSAEPEAEQAASDGLKQWFVAALQDKSPKPLSGEIASGDIATARKQVFKQYALATGELGGEKKFAKPMVVKKGMQVKPSKFQISEEDSMPYVVLQRGEQKPEGGWPLYIAMHGGGGYGKAKGPHTWPVNTREWQAQMQLSASKYPDNGLYFVPRMVNDKHGRWWKTYNSTSFDAMIKHAILYWDVNPNKVYMLGISEGGYGTEVLACVMPDKLAAANGMACGSGTSIHVENLFNLPFRTDTGEHDKAFGRINKAIAKHKLIDEYKQKDSKGYINELEIHKGRGHGIDYVPGPAWLTKHTRNPHPQKVVCTLFKTDAARNTGAYWLQAQNDLGNKDIYLTAEMDQATNSITVTAKATKGDAKYQAPDWQQALAPAGELVPAKGLKLRLWLHESQLDLAKPIKVKINGSVSIHNVKPGMDAMAESILKFGDTNYAYPAFIDLEVK